MMDRPVSRILVLFLMITSTEISLCRHLLTLLAAVKISGNSLSSSFSLGNHSAHNAINHLPSLNKHSAAIGKDVVSLSENDAHEETMVDATRIDIFEPIEGNSGTLLTLTFILKSLQ